MARRPLEREPVDLDGGRRTTQLMRDSLGSGHASTLIMDDQIPRLQNLVGEQLSSVIFVADYVQFDFNGPVFTAYSNPTAVHQGKPARFPDPSSRDMLCALILQQVQAVIELENERIELTFESGDQLVVRLDPASFRGPEAATFADPKVAGLRVW